jgi:hypothetical protein
VEQARGARWARCVAAGLAVFGAAFVLAAAVVFVYAFALAFEVRGAPDQARIQAFARAVGSALGPWLRIVLTAAAADWLGRTSRSAALEGALVGVVAGLAGLLLGWPPSVRGLAFLAGTIGAACVGALVGRRRCP